MPLLSDITDDAFLAGWSSSLTTLPDRFSNSLSTEDLLSLRYVEQSLNLALSSLQIRLGPNLEKAPVKAISELSLFTGKLQKSLCFEIHRSSAAEVFSLRPTTVILHVCAPVEAARLVAGWLKPNDFRLAAYLRLGSPRLCRCLLRLLRVQLCYRQPRLSPPNLQARRWSYLGSQHRLRLGRLRWRRGSFLKGGTAISIYLNNENRPDIVAFGFEAGVSMDLDISLAHPWSSEASRRSAVEDGAAAIIREESKVEKYDANIRPSGAAARFYPLVFEHFGLWGKLADEFFKVFLTHVDRTEGKFKGKSSPATGGAVFPSYCSVVIRGL